jgi:hypothetical protein
MDRILSSWFGGVGDYPKVPCPFCGTKHFTLVQAFCCAQAFYGKTVLKTELQTKQKVE